MGRKITLLITPPSESTYGEYSAHNQTIRINCDLEPAVFKRVLAHEITHAALAISGVSTYHLTDALEETICTINEAVIDDVQAALGKIKC